MSLAARCTACHTVFRVVQDQLKVSEGWVRCGRCGEVFNALAALLDLDRDAEALGLPPASSDAGPSSTTKTPNTSASSPTPDPAAIAAATAEAEGSQAPPPASPFEQDLADGPPSDALDRALFAPRRKDAASTPAASVRARDRNEFADAQFNVDLLADELQGADADAAAPSARAGPAPSAALLAPMDDAPEAPDFVRHADRRARWRSPRMRGLLSLALLLLATGLVLQVALHQRDRLAVTWPALEPALAAACGVLGCHLQPLRSISDITVESSALSRVSADSQAFQLAITLRNRGRVAVATPAVELSLTDASGRLVARRALLPQDFRPPTAVLPADSEVPLQLVLATPGATVSGYTVEVFYP